MLLLKNKDARIVHRGYYFPKVEIKNYNVMIDEQNFSDLQLEVILEHMITFRKMLHVKEMVTRLAVY